MENLKSLHLKIAKVLIDCASENKVISYGKLCKKVGFSNPRKIGAVLDPLTKLTYQKYNIFISVLVVLSESQKDELPMPSDGFFAMYNEVIPTNSLSKEEIVKTQRELAFNQDWSKLPEFIRESMKANDM